MSTSPSAARWGRLAATLAEHGHPVTVDERPYSEISYGRQINGVTRSVAIRLTNGNMIEIRDTWWKKNADVWTGWQVDLSDREGIVLHTAPCTKKRSDVARAVTDFAARAS